jgi:hypothetical protein
MVTTYTSLAGNETHMWIRNHDEYDKYFNETFNWDEFNVVSSVILIIESLRGDLRGM